MAPHSITPAVGAAYCCKPKAIWFRFAIVQVPRACHHSKRKHRWVGVKGSTRNEATIPNVPQPGTFVWFEKIQGPLEKVLPVPGWRPMKQLVARVHFVICGGLLEDWSIEGFLCLVIV
ncbi:e3 ubiquitin-protein ligase RNF13 [Trichonephila clavipes]|nr:e3 ubiquitin-protein ligase RNF13 [Trichonephila clavipes]